MHTMIGMTVLKYFVVSTPDLQCSGWSGSAQFFLAVLSRPGPFGLGLSILAIGFLAGATATPSNLTAPLTVTQADHDRPEYLVIRRHTRVHPGAQQIEVLRHWHRQAQSPCAPAVELGLHRHAFYECSGECLPFTKTQEHEQYGGLRW